MDDFEKIVFLIKSNNFNELNNIFEKGMNANLKLKNQKNFLHFAAECNEISFQIIQLLFKRGTEINVDKYGKNCLHYAAENKKVTKEIIELMLERKVSVNALDKEKNDPLFYYLKNNLPQQSILQCFFKNKVQINQKTTFGKPPFFLLFHNNKLEEEKKLELIEFFLNNDSDSNQNDKNCQNLLHLLPSTILNQKKMIPLVENFLSKLLNFSSTHFPFSHSACNQFDEYGKTPAHSFASSPFITPKLIKVFFYFLKMFFFLPLYYF